MGLFRRMFGGERRSSVSPPLNLRDPALAQWFLGANTIPNIFVTPRTAMRCPAVYAPIRLISGALSVLPLELFLRDDNGGRSKAIDSPMYDLVHSAPNAWMTSAQFRRVMTERMLGWGNSYARIINPGAPTALEPMHPDRVLPFRLPADGTVWYRYTPSNGPQITLAAFEVLHLRYGPACDDDGLISESPLLVNRETVALAMAASEYLARFFANYAVPKLILETPQTLTPAAGKELRKSWADKQAGLENAHNFAIVDGGMKVIPVSSTNDEAQFIQIYNAICGEISTKLYGIPPHLAGDSEKSTSWGTGIEQMNIGYVQHVLSPIIEEWEQSLDRTLLTAATRKQQFFEMNIDGLMRGDFKSRMDGFALMIQWALATPNEVRRMLNMPALPGGDSRLQPLNMVAAEHALTVLSSNPAKAARALRLINGNPTPEDLQNAA